jgi:hypothetical protein
MKFEGRGKSTKLNVDRTKWYLLIFDCDLARQKMKCKNWTNFLFAGSFVDTLNAKNLNRFQTWMFHTWPVLTDTSKAVGNFVILNRFFCDLRTTLDFPRHQMPNGWRYDLWLLMFIKLHLYSHLMKTPKKKKKEKFLKPFSRNIQQNNVVFQSSWQWVVETWFSLGILRLLIQLCLWKKGFRPEAFHSMFSEPPRKPSCSVG